MYKLNIIVGYGEVVFNVDLTYSHKFFWQCKNNSLYITGESNHLLGREAKGNISDVWKFNFATSFSFSLIEQLVGNNIWNSTVIGSVTLGLIESYMNNKTLEIFTSNRYVFIKHADDNTTLPFLDLQTGTVRDCFSYYGLLGTMPCYHDKITDNAWKYGNNLLDETSVSYLQLDSIADYSTSVALIGGVFASDSLLVAGETISAATLTTVGSILFVIALAIVFELSRPKLAEMLNNMGYHEMAQYYHTNNTLDIIWDAIKYFTTGELENVPYEQKLMFSLFYLSNLNLNYMFIGNMIINPNSDLYKLLNLTIFLLKSPDFDKQKEIIDNELKIIGNHGYDGIPSSPSPIERHGEKLRIAYEHAKLCWKAGNYVEFLKNWLIMDFIISITFAEIIDAWGEEIIDLLTGLENTSKG